jgi:flagellum-specific ATP synthase
LALALEHLLDELTQVPEYWYYGRVTAVLGLLVEVGGVERSLTIGSRCHVLASTGRRLTCEVIGFRNNRAILMPFESLEGVGLGCKVEMAEAESVVYPSAAWLGRVINAMGEPIDGKGPIAGGNVAYPLRNSPPPANQRRRVDEKIDLGVRAINTFLTCCRGQRLGIFSGSGVGKSILLGMLARYTASDVNVIGLVGERGREVQEFIDDNLGPEGLARSIVVVATSDESPLLRRQAAHLTLTAAEYFRDQGKRSLPPPRATPPRCSRSFRSSWSGPEQAGARERSRGCSRSWWRATTTTSRSPTRCAPFSTATSCSTAASPSAAATRRSTC